MDFLYENANDLAHPGYNLKLPKDRLLERLSFFVLEGDSAITHLRGIT